MAANDEVRGWITGRIPKDWFAGAPEIRADRDEVWVVGTLPDVELPGDTSPDAAAAARNGRIKQHREDTRETRMQISEEAQKRFGRPVSWGAQCGDVREMFTHLAIPAMTRLRLPEREVLDALVDSGVARSRAHALAWCVRLVRQNQGEWLKELKAAIEHVGAVRQQGPLN
ncbi:MAG TPA: hypothetical protein VGQ86_10510 [Candidatus Limnocylindria bacterium]|jgi:hypothetical protein|nr:hypothetical protein [Candidatus Limnocylindria bacterium]